MKLGKNKQGTVYALLVGINSYPQSPLRGCLNDVRHMEEYLQARLGGDTGGGDPYQLQLETLLESEATRERIIDRFRAHLGQARQGDTALFFFAGHGSQERPPLQYASLEADGWSETLMAYDSFEGHHLADKELAVLIAEVEKNGAHILIILDSCHSGSATRGSGDGAAATGDNNLEGVRQIAPAEIRRSNDSYWFAHEPQLPAVLETDAGWDILPYGPHVLLAACEDSQVAKECDSPRGERRGIFSYYLIELLQKLGPEKSYQQLLAHLRASVRQIYANQTPQAEGNLHQRFLGGLLPPRPRRYSLHQRGSDGWWLAAGRAHGMQPNTELRVLDPRDEGQEIARVRVLKTGGSESSIDLLEGALPKAWKAAEAEVCWLPMPPTTVSVEWQGVDSSEIEDELSESAYLRLTPRPTLNTLRVHLSKTGCRIRRGTSPVDLVQLPPEGSSGPAVRAILEKISRWDCLSRLQNPHGPLAGAVDLRFYRWRGPATGASSEPHLDLLDPAGELWLAYGEVPNDGPREPRITAELVNHTDRELYFALIALDEDFGITAVRHGAGRISPNANAWIRKLDGVQLAVPDRFHETGVTLRRDLLLLLLSESPVDLTPLEQSSIRQAVLRRGETRTAQRSTRAPAGLFESLLWRTGWREIDGPDFGDDLWDIRLQPLITERRRGWQRIDGSGRPLHPWEGLTLQPPQGWSGALRLHNQRAARHHHPALSDLPAKTTQELCPLSLSDPTTGDPGLSALEIRFDRTPQSANSAQLILEITESLAPNEKLTAALCGQDGQELIADQDPKTPGRCALNLTSATEPSDGRKQRTFWVQLYVAEG